MEACRRRTRRARKTPCSSSVEVAKRTAVPAAHDRGLRFAPAQKGEPLTPRHMQRWQRTRGPESRSRLRNGATSSKRCCAPFRDGERRFARRSSRRSGQPCCRRSITCCIRPKWNSRTPRGARLPRRGAGRLAGNGRRLAQPRRGRGRLDSDGSEIRFHRYQVNLLVDHAASSGAPVVTEDNPVFGNLIGRIEHLAQMGALVTNYNLIRAGALHRANGGYLVLDANRLFSHPYAWEGLKRALRAREIRIEPPAEAQGLGRCADARAGSGAMRAEGGIAGRPGGTTCSMKAIPISPNSSRLLPISRTTFPGLRGLNMNWRGFWRRWREATAARVRPERGRETDRGVVATRRGRREAVAADPPDGRPDARVGLLRGHPGRCNGRGEP